MRQALLLRQLPRPDGHRRSPTRRRVTAALRDLREDARSRRLLADLAGRAGRRCAWRSPGSPSPTSAACGQGRHDIAVDWDPVADEDRPYEPLARRRTASPDGSRFVVNSQGRLLIADADGRVGHRRHRRRRRGGLGLRGRAGRLRPGHLRRLRGPGRGRPRRPVRRAGRHRRPHRRGLQPGVGHRRRPDRGLRVDLRQRRQQRRPAAPTASSSTPPPPSSPPPDPGPSGR